MRCPRCGKRFRVGMRSCTCGYRLPPVPEFERRWKQALKAGAWGFIELLFGILTVSYFSHMGYPGTLIGIAIMIGLFGVFNLGYCIINIFRIRKMGR